ncbi:MULTISPECIES: MFS transporter [unclassified Burkholderia]|uniref:MFS transporter n=1 Tax=unclassified Burkholderia TaxID=2613784 RepID=UPI000F576817|nr:MULTISPECIES: MFS transporter [unclassified Burkholderia]RQR68752.1 MFS transporter [Burkholderia sp. Bp9012]RQR70071.1 MFS transporter [Burkholderia sp. Bp9011]RQR82985.1 MFS transporter [Burkholderia sp. Bp9010]RQZ39415.1 MFS transporter [Burkholderia sp. Bp9099]
MNKTEHQPFRAALAAFFGTMIEWYDFYCYGTAATLVFGDVFFATGDPLMGTLASLGTFAVGFVARPFGALIFGHLGDKIGRKRSLIITLVLMGTATTLIGLIPSYHSIGISAAAILVLLRLVQGIAVGGEWGGAVLIASEHAPEKWRTIIASAPQYGSPVGLILATLIFRVVSGLPQSDYQSWGWRIPFLISGALVIVAFIIRRNVNESPELERRKAEGKISDVAPVRLVFRNHKKALFLGIAFCMLGISGFYFVTTLMITFTTTYLKVSKPDILDIIAWTGVVELVSFPIGSYIAHRIGERKFLMFITGAATLWALPMMQLVSTGNVGNISIAILIATAFIGGYYAVLSAYLPRVFPVEMRYTGISLSFQLCGAVFGGTTPLIGLWVAKSFGAQWLPLGLMFLVITGATFLAAVFLPNKESVRSGEVEARSLHSV